MDKDRTKNPRLSIAVIMLAAMLLATNAISMSPAQNVFAGKDGKNQATSQTNACGNGELPINIGCQNTGSQIQGDENSVALAAQQTFPSVTPTPPPPPPPEETCEECFTEGLTDLEIAALEELLSVQFDDVTTIAQLCDLLDTLSGVELDLVIEAVVADLVALQIDELRIGEIINCVLRVLAD